MSKLNWKVNLLLLLIAAGGAGLIGLCLFVPIVRSLLLLVASGYWINYLVKH